MVAELCMWMFCHLKIRFANTIKNCTPCNVCGDVSCRPNRQPDKIIYLTLFKSILPNLKRLIIMLDLCLTSLVSYDSIKYNLILRFSMFRGSLIFRNKDES